MIRSTHSIRCVGFFAVLAGSSIFSCIRTAAGSSLTLTEPQRQRLIQIVHDDAEAGALFAKLQKSADAALADKPNPIAVIQTEGKLAADPVKIRTWQSLGDMPKLTALAYAYAVTSKPAYAEKIRQFVLAWAAVNHSAGDPIDDTNYEPLLIAYDFTRDTFSPADRDTADAYLRGLSAAEIRTGKLPRHTSVNNWNSHRLKVVGLIAFLLHDQPLIDNAVSGYKKQIAQNLLPDGTSIDLHERDAMHYQVYDLEPLLVLAIAARNNGVDLYDYEAAGGSSLAKSVAFVVPFAAGSKQHPEFVHSTVAFDRQRAAAGQAEYKAGTMWNPNAGLLTMALGEAFDPSLRPLVAKLAKKRESADPKVGGDRYPLWRIVLNEAERATKSSH
jgi:hypothetical protein